MMKNKPKTYIQELYPLWVEGIKSWFGWGGWRKTVTSLVISLGSIYAFLYFDQTEIAIENIEQLFFAVCFGLMWFLFVAIASYVSGNIKLYQNQKATQKEQESHKGRLQNSIDEKQNQISDLQKQITDLENQLRQEKRFASAEFIKLKLLKDLKGNVIGIEICNDEERQTFEGEVWITDLMGVVEKPRILPIKAMRMFSSETSFRVIPGACAEMRLIDMSNPDIPQILDSELHMNHFPISTSGEYIITTRVAGKFLSPDKSIIPIVSKWKVMLNIENREIDLVPI